MTMEEHSMHPLAKDFMDYKENGEVNAQEGLKVRVKAQNIL